LPARVPLELPDDPHAGRRELAAGKGTGVEEVEPRDAELVGGEGHGAAVRRHLDTGNIPTEVRDHRLERPTLEIEDSELAKLAAAIRDHPQAPAIGSGLATTPHYRLFSRLGGEQPSGAAVGVDQPEGALVD